MINSATLFIGKNHIHHSEVDSTNLYAKNLLSEQENVADGTLITAESQQNGRGQRGNTWITPPGVNLTVSVILTPKLLVREQFMLSKCVSLGISDSLAHFGIQSKIKWPNDIYIGHEKIAGVLIENIIKGSLIHRAVVGIGLNVNQTSFDPELPNPTSMKLQLQHELVLGEVLEQVLINLENRYMSLKNGHVDLINSDYLDRLYLKDNENLFVAGDEQFRGKIAGVDSLGRLAVQVESETRYFNFQEISYR